MTLKFSSSVIECSKAKKHSDCTRNVRCQCFQLQERDEIVPRWISVLRGRTNPLRYSITLNGFKRVVDLYNKVSFYT